MTEPVTRSSAVVQRYVGTVDRFTSDGIISVFGALAELEHKAFRAWLTAFEIQQEAGRLAAEAERQAERSHRRGSGQPMLNAAYIVRPEIQLENGRADAGFAAESRKPFEDCCFADRRWVGCENGPPCAALEWCKRPV
jgi:hypothetical protein